MVYFSGIDIKIKQLRTQRGLSQAALAKQLGISKSVASSYETGVHLPPYDILVQLSKIFGVSTDYLLGIESGKSVSVDGLTDIQIEAIVKIIDEMSAINKELNNY